MQVQEAINVVMSVARDGAFLSEDLRKSLKIVADEANSKTQKELRLIKLLKYLDTAYGGRGLVYDSMCVEDRQILEELRNHSSGTDLAGAEIRIDIPSPVKELSSAEDVFEYIQTCTATAHVVPGFKGLTVKKTLSHISLQYRVHNQGRRNIMKHPTSEPLKLKHIAKALSVYFHLEQQMKDGVLWENLQFTEPGSLIQVEIKTAYELMNFYLQRKNWVNLNAKTNLVVLIQRYFSSEMAHQPLSSMTPEVFRLSFIDCHCPARSAVDKVRVVGFFKDAYVFASKNPDVAPLTFKNFVHFIQ